MGNKKNQEEKLGSLFDIVVEALTYRIQSGEATAADIGNAIRLLQQNGVNLAKLSGTKLEELERSLPSLEELEEFCKRQ